MSKFPLILERKINLYWITSHGQQVRFVIQSCLFFTGTIFTGLADGRVVGFKGNDIWEITRFGKSLPECGNLFLNLYFPPQKCINFVDNNTLTYKYLQINFISANKYLFSKFWKCVSLWLNLMIMKDRWNRNWNGVPLDCCKSLSQIKLDHRIFVCVRLTLNIH